MFTNMSAARRSTRGQAAANASGGAAANVAETPSPVKRSSAATTPHGGAMSAQSSRTSASASRATTRIGTRSASGSITPATSVEADADGDSHMHDGADPDADEIDFLTKDVAQISRELEEKRRLGGSEFAITIPDTDESALSDAPEEVMAAFVPASSSTIAPLRPPRRNTSRRAIGPARPSIKARAMAEALNVRDTESESDSDVPMQGLVKSEDTGKKRSLAFEESDSDLSDAPVVKKVTTASKKRGGRASAGDEEAGGFIKPEKPTRGKARQPKVDVKGKGKAKEEPIDLSLGDVFSDDEQKPEYDDADSATDSELSEAEEEAAAALDSDDPLEELRAIERDREARGARLIKKAMAEAEAQAAFKISDESEYDESDGGEEDDEDEDGLAKGSMQEELKYETAKQRAKRIKSEKHKARLKKKSKLSHYEKVRIKLNVHHPELVGLWEAMKELPVRVPKATPQPDGLSIKLLPFQLEGVNWLVEQEKSEWKGGILADEMGMGKTIQMISLFLSDYKEKKGAALVIAPTVAIVQWRNEIEKYTKGMKVLIWHGNAKVNSVKELKKYDVVLTSYQTLERAFSKQIKGWRRKGQLIKEDSALHKIHWHRIVLDEAHNIKERATNVAKASFELEGDYRWCLSGTPLQNRVGELYSMIRFLGGDPFAYYYCLRCPCKSLHWNFPDRRSCASCGHTPMHHTCFWNNEILKPIQRGGMEVGEGKDAFGRLRVLLERLMLRRTKLERADDMGLPPRTVEVRQDMFAEEEEDLYESLYRDTTRKFSTYLDQGTVLNNYSNIFTLLTRMRLMANHPDLVLRSNTGMQAKLLGEGAENNRVCKICTDVAEDPIMSGCKHIFCRECIRQYLDADLGPNVHHDCPYCHVVLSIDLEQETVEGAPVGYDGAKQGIIGRLNMDKWRSSTKIEALVEELTQLREEDKTIKSLVFSQFVNFLDLIAFRLQRAGFSICRLEGNMTPEARDKTIKHFMNNAHVTVFLVSLKAGGVALNLTEASRVFLMDPWWNPSVEVQAMDRIHRLGQHRPIIVKRMIIENSIESRIIQLQNKKSAMIEAAIGKDDSAMGRLSVRDLRFLFTL